MKILFIPCPGAVIPHLLPLIALQNRLDRHRHETAFLVPASIHSALIAQNRNVLKIDYQRRTSFRNEMQAYGSFQPDIVVDDLSATALLTTALSNRARVAIARTGVFPGGVPRNSAHHHSMFSSLGSEVNVGAANLPQSYRNSKAVCGIQAPKTPAEMCLADMSIVPGIRSIEVLPPAIADQDIYAFAGALVLSDGEAPRKTAGRDDVVEFLERNKTRRIVYVTLGSVLKANDPIRELIRRLLAAGAAVVSNVALPDIQASCADTFFYSSFLPMHTVCSRSDLMIHHCGSGTYQFSILHTVPSICIGSAYYDRDDVAQRLQELGVAKYVTQDDEAKSFTERVCLTFADCLNPDSAWYRSAKEKLNVLKAENDRTAAAFDFERILRRASEIHRTGRRRAAPA